jgi:hypothetical protein
MTLRRLSHLFALIILCLIVSAVFCPTLQAQDLLAAAPLPDAPMRAPLVAAVSPVVRTPAHLNADHNYWDTKNGVLFSSAAVLNAADFVVTRANLRSGGQELNPVVRVFGHSTAGLAANFAGETAAALSLSYLFHKTGHHKLERAVYLVNIGTSTGAVSYGLMHR